MSREEIIDKLAEYFGIEPDYELQSYEWVSGSYKDNGKFLSLEEVVKALED